MSRSAADRQEDILAAIQRCVPWAAIAGLRNVVIHEYFRVRSDIVVDVVDNELAKLAATLAGTDLPD